MANQTPAPPGLQSPAALAQPLYFPPASSDATRQVPAVLLVSPFESSTSGTTVSTGNSAGNGANAFDTVSIGASATLTYDNSIQAAHGGLAAKITTPGVATNSYVAWTTSAGSVQTQVWFRLYLYYTANPTNTHRVWTALSGSTNCASLQVTTAGKLQFINTANVTILTSAASIPLNQWFRVEGYAIGSANTGQAEMKLFKSADSTVADETDTSAATQNTFGSFSAYRYGVSGSTASVSFWMDDIGLSNTAYLGPVGVSPSVPSAGSATPPGLQAPMSLARPVYFQSSSVQPAPGPPPTAPVLAAGQAAPGLVVEGAGASQAQPGRNPFSRVVSQPPAAPPAVAPTDLILTATEMASPDTVITAAGASVPALALGPQSKLIAAAQPPPPPPLTDLILIAQDTTPGFGSSLQAPLSPYSRILLVSGVTPGGYVTVICDLDDGSGNPPIAGTVTFVQSAVLTAPGTGIFARIPVTAAFTPWTPRPQVRLFATDNPGVTPQPWTWQVTFTGLIALPGSFSLLSASGPVQYLSALTPIA